MKRVLAAALCVLVTTLSTGSASTANADLQVRATISVWHDLNAICRGGSDTEIGCCARAKVGAVLNQMGYCYRMGERWVKCTARDKRAMPSTKLCY